MDENKVLVSVEVPRKKYYHEDILKAVMSNDILYFKSKDGDYFSLPLKIGNKKQTDQVLKIIKDYIDGKNKKFLKNKEKEQ